MHYGFPVEWKLWMVYKIKSVVFYFIQYIMEVAHQKHFGVVGLTRAPNCGKGTPKA